MSSYFAITEYILMLNVNCMYYAPYRIHIRSYIEINGISSYIKTNNIYIEKCSISLDVNSVTVNFILNLQHK